LLREKIVEQAARKFVVIVDESKLVERLGRGPLPVEVTRFAGPLLLKRFAEMKLKPKARLSGQSWLLTDEQHYIIDIAVPEAIDISAVVENLREMAGVVDTGFFPTEATEVIVAAERGVRVLKRDGR
jgi:ribose 5-phosphate isomerase A